MYAPEAQDDLLVDSHSGPEAIEQLILNRVDAADLGDTAKILVLAALLGDEDFASVLGGDRLPRRPEPSKAEKGSGPVGTYLDSIEVTGFRGIGPAATLKLHPGRGLTIVTGRNGSGKSSFAEAAEFALTGDNKRWAGRTSIWQDGWRNLHTTAEPRIRVHLGVEGRRNGAVIECHWPSASRLIDATSFLQVASEKRQLVSDLGWGRAFELYRPFLSYAELGGLLSGKPSEMHDSLYRILGLDCIVAIETLLKDARKSMDDRRKLGAAALPALQQTLAAHPDPRARTAEGYIAVDDLDALDALAGAVEAAVDDSLLPLRQLEILELPGTATITAIVGRLRDAVDTIKEMAGTPTQEARTVAGLLRAALAHYQTHPDQSCPVCSGRVLDAGWATTAQSELDRLTQQARRLDHAHQAVPKEIQALRAAFPNAPIALAADLTGDGIDGAEALARWEQWEKLLATAEPSSIADLAPVMYEQLVGAFEPVRAAARAALTHRQQAWQPAAEQIRTWVATARDSQHAKRMHSALQDAISWMHKVADDIRNARLKPVADAATGIWNTLRQESNVNLDAIRLAGTGTSRRVDLNVTVDGVASAALGVMSQGELHSLALALFLPRAAMPESPFRFLVIDDPVQSMDPAKVYGLASVLDQVARQRQVIVFTHDDRLPAAVRQLQIKARIVTVNRRAGSTVSVAVNASGSPARRYLSDAYAITKDVAITDDVRGVIVAGLVRDAIECACQEVIRRRDFRAGVPIADTELSIEAAPRLRSLLGLALKETGDASESAMRRLHLATPWVVKVANKGAHGESVIDLGDFVSGACKVVTSLETL